MNMPTSRRWEEGSGSVAERLRDSSLRESTYVSIYYLLDTKTTGGVLLYKNGLQQRGEPAKLSETFPSNISSLPQRFDSVQNPTSQPSQSMLEYFDIIMGVEVGGRRRSFWLSTRSLLGQMCSVSPPRRDSGQLGGVSGCIN